MSIVSDYDPSLLADLKPAVARLRTADFTSQGTGFLVSPTELVTCQHVVQTLESGKGRVRCRVGETNAAAEGTLVRKDEAADVAVLRLDQPLSGVQPLRTADAGQLFTRWVGYGFPGFAE